MTPSQFVSKVAKGNLQPAYLFLGPETFRRSLCRRALLARFGGEDADESVLTRLDLQEVTLAAALDDAKSLSLFAADRILWVSGAESALPRGRSADSEEGESKSKADCAGLEEYMSNPTSGTVLVFDSAKYDFDGEDKAKSERVRKFYKAIPTVVEFARLDGQESRVFAKEEADRLGVQVGAPELEMLVEATGGDPGRLVTELEKLAIYAGNEARITEEQIATLVPNARETTIFALVNALSRRDRLQSLDLLDVLVREGEYLPLALTFLATLFRQALAAKEQNLRSTWDVQGYFQKQGVAMWKTRAEQISQTAQRFRAEQLRQALELTFRADRDMKGTRPDDRLVMENYVWKLTA